MAAVLHFLTASVRASLSLRSLLTYFLGGPSTSTASSIKGGEDEVTLHQMACHFPLLRIAGLAPVGRAAGKERAYEAVLLS